MNVQVEIEKHEDEIHEGMPPESSEIEIFEDDLHGDSPMEPIEENE